MPDPVVRCPRCGCEFSAPPETAVDPPPEKAVTGPEEWPEQPYETR